MSVKLRKRKNANGTTTLMLDIYHNGERRYERLGHLQLSKPSSLKDRENNKELFQKAEAIRLVRAVELEGSNYNMASDTGKKTLVTTWMQTYIDKYKKKDKRNMQGARNRFVNFLGEIGKPGLTFAKLNALIIEDFMDYLEAGCTGEGASSYFTRFKKMIRHAYRQKILNDNVLDFVERKIKGRAKKKDILTIQEIQKLSITPTESSEVRRAFLFSCVSGLRWIDIKALKWSNINLQSKQMDIAQAKTGEAVATPLNDTAVKLLGEQRAADSHVFDLPTANGANKTVKAWVKRAKIDKKITWHNARHSFGTNLIFNEVDVLTASKLLGHTTMKHTQRYIKASEEMKQTATNKLNFDL